MRPTVTSAVAHINRAGIVLLYPARTQPHTPSLWKCFYPKSKMKWDWSEDADNRVAELWYLRERLAESHKVAYLKWYQGRATFISLPLFSIMLSALNVERPALLERDASSLLSELEDDSPLATKELRARTEMTGKLMEGAFTRGMKQLWQKMLVVGCGESDEGGYPSLSVGSTKLIFEDLWDEAMARSADEAKAELMKKLDAASPFVKYLNRLGSAKKR